MNSRQSAHRSTGMQTRSATRIRRGVLDRTRAVAALYAGILRVHPFVDGNHRVSFVALSAALWSFGLPNVEFEDDRETIAHDDALVPALESEHGSIERFAQLLADLIQRSIGSQA